MDIKQYLVSKARYFRKELEKGYAESEEKHPRIHRLAPFMAKLFIAGLAFRLLIFLDPNTYMLQEYLAAATVETLNFFGGNYLLDKALIMGENADYLITRDCLGWKSVSAFIGLVFASTSEFARHLKIVAFGVTGLLAANLVRVVTTVWLSEIGIISFEIIHTFLWRWGMTLLVLVFWFVWLKNVETANSRNL